MLKINGIRFTDQEQQVLRGFLEHANGDLKLEIREREPSSGLSSQEWDAFEDKLIAANLNDLITGDAFIVLMNPVFDAIEEYERANRMTDHSSQTPEGLAIFLSHSGQDRPIAEKLTKLIQAAFRLRSKEIRCTSVNGHKLRIGADTEATLRQEVLSSQVVLGLITEVSMDSAWVLFELGARWGHQKSILPLVAAGQTPGILAGPLGGKNALSCDDRKDLQQLIDDLASYFNSVPESPQNYEDEIVALLEVSERVAGERGSVEMISSENVSAEQNDGAIRISLEASWLLMQASLDRHGTISSSSGVSFGLEIRTRGKQFVVRDDPRSRTTWKSALDELEQRGFVEDPKGMRAIYRVSELGFKHADELWGICLLKTLERLQDSEWEFIKVERLAERAELGLDEKSRLELQRYLSNLSERQFIEPVHGDGSIAGGRLTLKGRAHIKPFMHVDFAGLP